MQKIVHGRHFVEEGFTSHATFLPDDIYSQVLDNIVVACAEIVLLNNKGEMLLAKRQQEPQADWWIIGGRMKPGESFEQAAARNIKRELSINIKQKRFKYFCTYSTAWTRRAQEPKENGSHTTSTTMIVVVSEREVKSMKHSEEYSAMQWLAPVVIIAGRSTFHRAVVMLARNVISYKKSVG